MIHISNILTQVSDFCFDFRQLPCKTQWLEVNLANPTTSDNFVYDSGDNCCVAIAISEAVVVVDQFTPVYLFTDTPKFLQKHYTVIQ